MTALTIDDLPPHFYKYRSLNGDAKKFTHDIILNNRLFWPSPANFNDPFDCSPAYSNQGSKLKQQFAYRKMINDHFRGHLKAEKKARVAEALRVAPEVFQARMAENRRRTMSETAVCCLSSVPDNILMWTHYASADEGICLRFTPVNKNADFFIKQLMHFEFAHPVEYSSQRPVINVLKDDNDEHLRLALLTKADFWSYEHEWRMIGYRKGPGLFDFPEVCFDGIIFGARVSTEDRDEVMALIMKRRFPIDVFDTEFDPTQFRLHLVKR